MFFLHVHLSDLSSVFVWVHFFVTFRCCCFPFAQVAHELLALQLLTVLLEEPTDDSVEIAVNFTKEIGQVKPPHPKSCPVGLSALTSLQVELLKNRWLSCMHVAVRSMGCGAGTS